MRAGKREKEPTPPDPVVEPEVYKVQTGFPAKRDLAELAEADVTPRSETTY